LLLHPRHGGRVRGAARTSGGPAAGPRDCGAGPGGVWGPLHAARRALPPSHDPRARLPVRVGDARLPAREGPPLHDHGVPAVSRVPSSGRRGSGRAVPTRGDPPRGEPARPGDRDPGAPGRGPGRVLGARIRHGTVELEVPMHRSRLILSLAAALVGLGLATALGVLVLAPARAAVGPLRSEGLGLPADARFLVGIDARRLVESPLYARFAKGPGAMRPDVFKALEEQTGLNPEKDVREVVIAGGLGGGKGAVALVVGDFDPA